MNLSNISTQKNVQMYVCKLYVYVYTMYIFMYKCTDIQLHWFILNTINNKCNNKI